MSSIGVAENRRLLVPSNLDRLGEIFDGQLKPKVEQLETRLNGVLRNEPQSESGVRADKSSSNCPIADALDNLADDAERLAARLENILDRLEV